MRVLSGLALDRATPQKKPTRPMRNRLVGRGRH
jgi:hypothetical protein